MGKKLKTQNKLFEIILKETWNTVFYVLKSAEQYCYAKFNQQHWYVEDFTLKHLLLFEICAREIYEKFVYKHSKQ